MRFFTSFVAVLCTVLLATGLYAQNLRPAALVDAARAEQRFEESYDLFTTPKNTAGVGSLDAVGADYVTFDLVADQLTDLRKSAPAELELTLPGAVGKVALVQADLFAEGFRVTQSSTNRYTKAPLGLHYRGVVDGDASSLVAISVFDGEISGVVGTKAGNYVIGKMSDKSGRHVIYNDRDLPTADLGECGTPDSGLPYSAKDLADLEPGQKDANNCVNVYLEIDYSIFQQRGSTANVTSFITGLFNQTAILYANEQINLVLSELYVWDTPDPFNAGSSGDNLTAFRNTRTSFNGDLAHLVSFQASGGVAYVDVLCVPSYAYGFSSINNSYNNVPSYSWSVSVLAHELGHNFGSQHTHACVWNGNNTAIDGCYAPQGSCAQPSGLPSNGGTIMSYCHLTSAGINFNNGFGPQPGNLMRNRAYNGSCLSACSTTPPGGGGGGGGGGDDTGCTENVVTVTILTDNYPGETAWTLADASGATVASGGNYSTNNTTYSEEVCLPDGCYTFTITDSYGDGICCAYGNGAYTINVNGTDEVTGGQFGDSATEQVCAQTGGGDGGGGDDEPDVCNAFDFATNPPGSYGGTQDKGTVTVLDATSIVLQNNAWKAVLFDYTITPNTVLEFDFGSTQEGEIHGIGFDNNNGISSSLTFKLHGTQRWGIRTYDDYDTPGAWKSYSIPVGQRYTGTFNRLFFTMDHDGGARNGNAYFRNVRIYEGADCVAFMSASGEMIRTEPETQNTAPQVSRMDAFPNPASDVVNLNVASTGNANAAVRIVDLTGRTVRHLTVSLATGEQRLSIPVADLPVGTYLVRLDADTGFAATAKFTVAR